MIVQDSRTGYYHEVPDYHLGGYGRVVYDGLGNPIGGLWDDITGAVKTVTGAAQNLVSNIPVVGQLASKFVAPLVNQFIPGGLPTPASPLPGLPPLPFPPGLIPPLPLPGMMPGISNLFNNQAQGGLPYPEGMTAAPWPYQWVRPQGPLMAGPRRLYLRCSAWPGPAGLVPDPATSGTSTVDPTLFPAPVTVPRGGTFHRRHHRRHR
jgi:hypothetical protein